MKSFNHRNKIFMLFSALCLLIISCDAISHISGIVFDDNGPVSGATVRLQTTSNFVRVQDVAPMTDDLEIELITYQTGDNETYEWRMPAGDDSCETCHPAVTDIWKENAHAGSAMNERFLTLYNGTDINGNQSPLTRYVTRKDYGTVPLPPDPSLPYYGPGYKLDFPDTKGNCAACHIPGAAVDNPYGIDPNDVTGADEFGIHCDYCHKIADVHIDNATGLPSLNMPGILSTDIRRPFTTDPDRSQLFFGTFDDVNAAADDTNLPLLQESRFCAPCHFGVFWDTVVYNSFGEWLDSPYSDPETGQTCQQCHMPSPTLYNGDAVTNIAPGNGGVERNPSTIHAHLQRGPNDEVFMQKSLAMNVSAAIDNNTVVVTVTITNDNTGHHIPTDSPLRHLILVVEAADSQDQLLDQIDGSTVPQWGGIGDPSQGYYAGLPGKGYAKILQELWTQISPTGAYWNHTRIVSDNRIAAMESDTSTYTFSPSHDTMSINVTLLYRCAYIELMDWKL